MRRVYRATSRSSLQIPARPETAALRPPRSVLLDDNQPPLVRAIINPKRGMEAPQAHTPRPSGGCNSQGSAGRSCGSLDVRVVVLLVTLGGAVILLLLYKLLQLRHRLRLAQARHALEYYSFYHTATYTLKHPTAPCLEPPTKNGTPPEAVPSVAVRATPTLSTQEPPALPPPPLPPPPVLPPLPLHPPPPRPVTPPVLPLPLHLPMIHTIPPSPHSSWGACSDADVYSRIGAFRPSRLSSLSSQSTVILFEHSSL